jgi:hypothetical protein
MIRGGYGLARRTGKRSSLNGGRQAALISACPCPIRRQGFAASPPAAGKRSLRSRAAALDGLTSRAMVNRIRQLPEVRPLPPLAIDAVPVRLLGWIHGRRAYAFATEPDVDGKYQAAVLNFDTGKPEHAWPCETPEQAQAIAAQEFAAAAYGAPKDATVYTSPKVPPVAGPEN